MTWGGLKVESWKGMCGSQSPVGEAVKSHRCNVWCDTELPAPPGLTVTVTSTKFFLTNYHTFTGQSQTVFLWEKTIFHFYYFLYVCFLPDRTIKLQRYVLSCPLLVSAFFAVFPLVPCSSPPRKHPPGKRIIEWQRLTCTLPKTLWFWFGERLYRKENLQSGPVGKINSPKFFHNYTVAQRQGEKSAARRALSVKHAFCSLALTPPPLQQHSLVIVTKGWCGFCGRKTCKWDKSIAWHKMQWGGSSVKAYFNIF